MAREDLRNNLIERLNLSASSTDKEIVSKVSDLQTMIAMLEEENERLKTPNGRIVNYSKTDLLKMTLISRPEIKEVFMAKDKSHYHLRAPKGGDYAVVSRDEILK